MMIVHILKFFIKLNECCSCYYELSLVNFFFFFFLSEIHFPESETEYHFRQGETEGIQNFSAFFFFFKLEHNLHSASAIQDSHSLLSWSLPTPVWFSCLACWNCSPAWPACRVCPSLSPSPLWMMRMAVVGTRVPNSRLMCSALLLDCGT